ncbi:MAG: hypothetical protein DMG42_09980 [Acidobacteria bacterium]|nr:MAG: hypothetical protein DMG42_09980 [Acidobacteriota bacterium]
MRFLAGEQSGSCHFPSALVPSYAPPKRFKSTSARRNADLTLLRGDGNIFVSTDEWLALPFRNVPDRNPAAA